MAARFVQGIGGALSSSVIVAIIVTEFPSPVERAKAMSAYVFVAVGGGSIGLLAGGVLTQALSWHWIFFVNVPIGIATLILGRLLVVENVGLGIKQGVDVVGSVLVTLSLMVGIYGIVTASSDGWVSAHTLGILGVAVVLFVSFIVLESRLANPIMPLRILKLRTLDRLERHPGPAGHGHVLDLLHRRALPRARARLQPHQDRPGLHAGDGGHGDHVGRAHGAPRQPLRQQGDVPGHAPRRGRPGPARVRGSGCGLLPEDLLRLPHAGRGRRRLVHAAAADRHVRDPQRRRRPGLGHRQRVPADGGRRGPGRAEHDRHQPDQVAGRAGPRA